MPDPQTQLVGLPGFRGYYVRQDGSVWSIRTGELRRLKGIQQRSGYLMVSLYQGSRKKVRGCLIHRLILECFVGPCPRPKQARHLNGKRNDNRLENLAWGSARENAKDRETHGTTARGERSAGAVLTESNILKARDTIIRGRSQKTVATELGVHPSTLSDALRGRSWKHLVLDKSAIPIYRGARCKNARLTEDVVRAIRREAACGTSYRLIAKQCGITFSNVGRIVRRERWKHIDP